ncbi:MAG: choice-of-anchor tandem repeat GloVer-containing protein, partial [Chthoniobacteraceae bacterium]
ARVAAAAPAVPIYESLNGFSIPAASPIGELIEGIDGNFYGTTSDGGTGGYGTIFKTTPAGVVTTLVEFTGNGPSNKGATPAAGLLLAKDGDFYGTTAKGGANDLGTIFKVTTAGTLTTLVEFTGNGAINKGSLPYAGLTQAADGTFHGTTARGGSAGFGTMFAMSAGGVLTTLVEFTGNAGSYKGAYPYATVIEGIDGSYYGTTSRGGATGNGTVFRWTAPAVFETLVQFTDNGATAKGASPYAPLVQGPDHNFYGTTANGGTNNFGTVFQMTPTGVLNTLAMFSGNGATNKGSYPESALVIGQDGKFYGTTFSGGTNGAGTIFNITTAGTLTTLASFTGKAGDAKGATPESALVLATNGSFYGTTFRGGTNDVGTIFKLTTTGATPVLSTLFEFSRPNAGAYFQAGLVRGIDGNFYGTTASNGVYGKGTVFKLTPAGTMTTLVEFTGNGPTNKGTSPYAALIQTNDGNLYGTTAAGGANDLGTIFKVTTDGVLTTLVELTGNGAGNKGSSPDAALIQGIDGKFYGTTSKGGASDLGTVFAVTSGGALTTLVEFSGNLAGNKGAFPYTALIQDAGGTFYGTTSKGGVKNLGTVFSMTAGGALTTLVEFADDAATKKGAYPEAPLTFGPDGSIYGTTATGGATGNGTLFKVTTGGALTTLFEFSGNAGAFPGTFPQAALTLASDGNLYGAAGFGGASGFGTLFKITPAGALTTLAAPVYNVTTKPGVYPQAGLTAGSDGNFYGTTLSGGLHGVGGIFRLRLRAVPVPQAASSVESQLARLNAVVSPGVLDATVSFQFGTTINYGSTTPGQAIGHGLTQVPVSAALANLDPNTTYHFRVVMTDSSGTVTGADQSFTTEPLSTKAIATGDTIGSETVASLGVPSIDDSGAIVVLATLASATSKVPAILAGRPPAVVARLGQPAPKPDGSLSNTRVFSKFSDPACDKLGKVAFAAGIKDGAIARTGLWSDATGALKEVALVGGEVAGVANAHFAALSSFAISGSGEVFYLATIAGTGVPAGTGMGVWAFDGGGNHLLLRQGDLVNGIKIQTINVLTVTAGSPGQGRYKDGSLAVLVTLANKTQAILNVHAGAALEIVAATGDSVTGLPQGNQLQTFGIPTVSANGNSAFLATMLNGAGGVSAASNQVILADSNAATLAPVARKGDPTPAADGTNFAVLGNPVYNAQSAAAFISTLTGTGVVPTNNTGIWWNGPNGLKLVARAGGDAAGVPGAKWASFSSLALPDNADPVFVAKLAPGTGGTLLPNGVGATNNIGVWAIDSTATLRLVVRTGDILKVGGQPKTLSLMTVLSPVLGSAGQARSYNSTRYLVFRATFTDRTQAIMQLVIP